MRVREDRIATYAVQNSGTVEELEEVLSLSDRILVIYEGRIVGEFPPSATEEELGFAMTGGGQGFDHAAGEAA